jgi:hypothetical protein
MTIPEGDWELLHREMDGENGPEASARLRERLALEPELDACYRALLGVGRALSEVRLVDPPGEIVGDVMRRVRPGRRRLVPGRRWLAGLLAGHPALALASSLAVGVLAGVLAAGGGRMGRVEEASVSGTALSSARLQALPVIDEAHIEGFGMRASAAAHRKGDVVVAEIELESEHPVDLTIGVSGRDLRPSGFESADGPTAGEVLLDAAGLRARGLSSGRYLLVLRAVGSNPGSLQLRLESPQGGLEGRLRSGPSSR